MRIRLCCSFVLGWALAIAPTAAQAVFLDTVNWAPDGTTDGTGTGTLGGSNIVTYNTVVGVGNAGVTLADNWNVSLATDGVVGTGATFLTGGVFGTVVLPPGNVAPNFIQSIMFSAPVTNPILLVNFTDATSAMNFGSQSLTLLDSNNAQLTGGVFTFVGSTNSFDDGFAARVNGTFGPGTPIVFDYITTVAFDSVAFTVGSPSAVPEPSSFALAASAVPLGLGYWLRRRRQATS